MAPPREPLFLARESYRRRRLVDAVRLLPVVGGVFFLVPILGSGGAARSTAQGGIYLFGVWLVLIVLSAALTRRLSRAPDSGNEERDDPAGQTRR